MYFEYIFADTSPKPILNLTKLSIKFKKYYLKLININPFEHRNSVVNCIH